MFTNFLVVLLKLLLNVQSVQGKILTGNWTLVRVYVFKLLMCQGSI
jgi:hypothetical protein